MTQAVEVAKICEENFHSDIDQVAVEIQSLKGYVRQSLENIRQIIYDLRPMSLDDLGLIPTLQRYISDFEEETSIDILYKTSHSMANISSIISLTVFRVVQECLSNIKKHSQAKSARVIIEFLYDKLNLVISDDGIGIESDNIKPDRFDFSQNFGLLSIKERVELLKGNFEMVSIPNQGTRIFVSLPLSSNQNEFVMS
jgi:two-component system sensor histidine kinase DegS